MCARYDHLSLYPMNGSRADAERLRRFEDARAWQQTKLPRQQLAGRSTLTQAIVAGPLFTAFGAADPGIGKDRNHIPPVPLGDRFKLPLLVLDGLLCRGHSQIKGNAL